MYQVGIIFKKNLNFSDVVLKGTLAMSLNIVAGMYVCMYVCMDVCMHAYNIVDDHVRISIYVYACMHICLAVNM